MYSDLTRQTSLERILILRPNQNRQTISQRKCKLTSSQSSAVSAPDFLKCPIGYNNACNSFSCHDTVVCLFKSMSDRFICSSAPQFESVGFSGSYVKASNRGLIPCVESQRCFLTSEMNAYLGRFRLVRFVGIIDVRCCTRPVYVVYRHDHAIITNECDVENVSW